MDEIKTITAGVGSPDFDDILAMADAMRESIVPGFDWSDPHTMAKAITAAAMFAGTMFGQSIVVGIAKDGDRRRAGEMVLTNFRQGIAAGKRRGYRIAAELGEGGLEQ